MSIDFTRYISITSGVGGATVVPQRNLILRLFTDNNLLPPQSVIEFSNADLVGAYFGTTSEEYKRAVYYFGFLSKNITSPRLISYARYVGYATAAKIYGYADPLAPQALATYNPITSGAFVMTMNSVTATVGSLDFSLAGSLAAVAAIIQVGIRAASGAAEWTAATVTYDAVNKRFVFVAGITGALSSFSVAPSLAGTNIATIMGWYPQGSIISGVFAGAIWANGSALETPVVAVTASDALDNNFGSFIFMPSIMAAVLSSSITVTGLSDTSGLQVGASVTGVGIPANTTIATIVSGTSITLSAAATVTGAAPLSFGLSLAQTIAVAQWNKAKNVKYAYSVAVNSSNATAWASQSSGLGLIGGVSATLNVVTAEYPEMLPTMIEAATDYTQPNAAQNYMFQQSNLSATVTTDSAANVYDALRINYYGQTQTAGQLIKFYQRGIMFGLPTTDPLDMNTYVNEIWLKDAMGSALMGLLLALNQLPANAQGRSQGLAIQQPVIDQALSNAVISVGKPLSQTQRLYIAQVTGDPNAYHQVQNAGYWLDAQIVLDTNTNEYVYAYTLVYSKDDVIRKATGRHILI